MSQLTEKLIRYRSFIGFLCLVAMLCLATPNARSIFAGFLLMMAGMFFRAWSSGHINKGMELATEGPYSLTRNPLYFGSLILGSGVAVACNHMIAYLIFVVYYFAFFTFLIAIERKRMHQRFGRQYEAWAKEANLFFPRIKKAKKSNFNIAFYMRNREYRVLFFSLFVIAVLIVKFLKKIEFFDTIGK
ncbi:MAG: isoprenylcysteine carboxylmethyltransferase family protein [Candidatus Aminicenantes bacterium]|nr:isoprenylcysteine carboxylmethyltransferase family protein [Candidatus Aminicenantes bacterium]